jgi:hypothetical protein
VFLENTIQQLPKKFSQIVEREVPGPVPVPFIEEPTADTYPKQNESIAKLSPLFLEDPC